MDIDGIILSLRIREYAITNSKDWDLVWCSVDFCLESEPWLKYIISNDPILLASEVDDLIARLEGLLDDRIIENTEYECIEPDFCFKFLPKKDLRLDPKYEYVPPENAIVDIQLEWKVFFWNSGLTDNFISINLNRTQIEQLLIYLKVVVGSLSEENSETVKQLIQKNILY